MTLWVFMMKSVVSKLLQSFSLISHLGLCWGLLPIWFLIVQSPLLPYLYLGPVHQIWLRFPHVCAILLKVQNVLQWEWYSVFSPVRVRGGAILGSGQCPGFCLDWWILTWLKVPFPTCPLLGALPPCPSHPTLPGAQWTLHGCSRDERVKDSGS